MTSSGKNGLNIRTNASPKWDRTRWSGGVSVLCWLAAPVAMFYGNLQSYMYTGKKHPREKEGDLTQSYDKTPYTKRKFENQRTTHKRHQKLRLHNDCGPT